MGWTSVYDSFNSENLHACNCQFNSTFSTRSVYSLAENGFTLVKDVFNGMIKTNLRRRFSLDKAKNNKIEDKATNANQKQPAKQSGSRGIEIGGIRTYLFCRSRCCFRLLSSASESESDAPLKFSSVRIEQEPITSHGLLITGQREVLGQTTHR